MIVRAMSPDRLPWLASRAKLEIHPGLMAIEAVDEAGETLGAVGYDGWWAGACAVHIALESPIALRRLVTAGFGAAFDEPPRGFGKRAVTACVLSTNEKSLRLVRKLGFRHIHTGKGYGGPGIDVEFFEMERSTCKYVPRRIRDGRAAR